MSQIRRTQLIGLLVLLFAPSLATADDDCPFGVLSGFAGKGGLLTGYRNQWSYTAGVLPHVVRGGANVVMGYNSDRVRKQVERIQDKVNDSDDPGKIVGIVQMDGTNPASVERAMAEANDHLDGKGLDFLLHGMAWGPVTEVERFVDVPWDQLMKSIQVSAASLQLMAQKAEPLLNPGSSIVTVSYGTSGVTPGYNVMGAQKRYLEAIMEMLAVEMGPNTRVNSVSPGPFASVSGRAVGVNDMIGFYERNAPRSYDPALLGIGYPAAQLLEPGSSPVTGVNLPVDGGMHLLRPSQTLTESGSEPGSD